MRFIPFKEALKHKTIFSLNDIRKIAPDFHRSQLVHWQKAGYITKIRNGIYCFSGLELNESILLYTANQIYRPSYISLQSAMEYYHLIPEAVFSVTSVSTRKTNIFKTPVGNFSYNHIKPDYFFGYKLLNINNLTIKIAEPEKMILDYCHLKKPASVADFDALRLDKENLRRIIDREKLDHWLEYYHSAIMNKRIQIFKKFLYD